MKKLIKSILAMFVIIYFLTSSSNFIFAGDNGDPWGNRSKYTSIPSIKTVTTDAYYEKVN